MADDDEPTSASRRASGSDDALLAQAPGNMLVRVDDIAAARLSKRGGICTLRVETSDDRTLRWRWMNTP